MRPSRSPLYPAHIPMTSQPLKKAVRATALTAAFIPGASPPLVNTPILKHASSYSRSWTEYTETGRPSRTPAMRFADHQPSQLPFGARQRAGTAIEDSWSVVSQRWGDFRMHGQKRLDLPRESNKI